MPSLLSLASLPSTKPTTPVGEVTQATVEAGRVFGTGGTDGLILYAFVLLAFFSFLALIVTLWLHSKERTRASVAAEKMAADFAAAAASSAEASKELATAVASAASADLTFKAAMAGQLDRLDREAQSRGSP